MCLSLRDFHYLVSTGVDISVIQTSQHDTLRQSRISSNMTSPPSGCNTSLQAQLYPTWSKHQNLEENCTHEGLTYVMIHRVQTKLPLGVSVWVKMRAVCLECMNHKINIVLWLNHKTTVTVDRCLFDRIVWTYMQNRKWAWLRMSTSVATLTLLHTDERNWDYLT